ncbi:MAG: hypothetical protein COU06_02330 [Candidatus Harrisonbacteria bacterium CG10_big_fil_rev_8_21_14_0_10_38_8]|uniref:Thioredoxin domain-containing protein n=1 Tax=Candidatus Harrisonbacteria bacterium CG10_big_fil_rev_8_21_14_0_10_38_8 TaxID=1974582 RepID=A0A2M6WJS3_9BACT|nr:MAG: hypothetical protein COU06_02330 [Candidatus Harrisonbacteria bacterium CG10_big_fil_rev_8_21_14_0_10_38_8]
MKNTAILIIVTLLVVGVGVGFAISQIREPSTSIDLPEITQSKEEILQAREEDWKKGVEGAPVTIIEYSDFQCPACDFYHDIVNQLGERDDVLVIYRHYPLIEIHGQADLAGRAAEAAGNQGLFWQMHDKLFENQDSWSANSKARSMFLTYASELNLDIEQFTLDLDSQEATTKVLMGRQEAVKLGATGTPTFFVNGDALGSNPQSLEDFIQLIESVKNQ